eukprot:g6622.t1
MVTLLRPRVLSLYREILRTARTWEVASESEMIRQEAAEAFRAHRCLAADEAAVKLEAGLQRLELGKHYKIPWERPMHYGGGGAEGLAPHKQNVNVFQGRKRININGATRWEGGPDSSGGGPGGIGGPPGVGHPGRQPAVAVPARREFIKK